MNGHHRILPPGARPCVWMAAGLIRYHLCDREFDCERCPLDRALRRTSPERAGGRAGPRSGRTWRFPDDRRYVAGHLWIRSPDGGEGGRVRLGADALVGALAGACRAVRWRPAPRPVRAGERFCTLELDVGGLDLHSPLAGRLESVNSGLAERPDRVLDDPYGAGWLAELEPDAPDGGETYVAHDMERRAELDLRRFRRAAALRMMTDAELGPILADGGHPLCDLREMLGSTAYLGLLAELIH